MANTDSIYTLCRGAHGEWYIRRNTENGHDYFVGYDAMGTAVFDSFDIDYDFDEETARAHLADLRAAE